MRCLPQKRFWQKPQSPTMGCAADLHPSFVQRGLLDLRFVDVGVLVPDVAADDAGCDSEVARVVVVMSEDSGS